MQDFKKILRSEEIKNFLENNKNGVKQVVLNAPNDAKAILLSITEKRFIFVVKDMISASRVAEGLASFDLNPKFIFAGFENNLGLIDFSASIDFYSNLFDFIKNKSKALIVCVDALFQKLPSFEIFRKNIFSLKKGGDYSFKNLSARLLDMGYVRVEEVSMRGQFSLRGDIFEIFPINEENLYRLEFFDTELEKISAISAGERKFKFEAENLDILGINQESGDGNILTFLSEFEKFLKNKNKNQDDLNFKENKNQSGLMVCFDEPVALQTLRDYFVKSNGESEFYVPSAKIFECGIKNQIAFASIQGKTFFVAEDIIPLRALACKKYVFDFPELAKDAKIHLDMGNDIFIFCGSAENKKHMQDFLTQNLIFPADIDDFYKIVSGEKQNKNKLKENKVYLLEDFLPYSFSIVKTGAIIIGTNDIFKKQKKKNSQDKKNVFYVPKINDLVVHETHGVGRCVGIEKLNLIGTEKDYFVIEYAGGDKFYLPSENATSISAYFGGDGAPKLNKLGGADFARLKERVYKNIKKLAFDLLELYAKREESKGFIYQKDDYLMEMFENAFPFEETADQLGAISDIKKDMESEKIMDRLICGDVGYGKTEVALRAIYKAVLSGKQAMFLCPTTILSEQHYKTCLKRFSGFMVKTARLNRLMSQSEQTAVLRGLKDGTINVVCGTHKLLSKDVEFKNLGLLVLDEEQRFGVEDKEKIKNIKNNIDVLTLSATPIPRTLHMSLSGIRDISIIDTPPKERIPIQTFVTEYSDDLIVRAVNNEMARQGQVLIIFNRVEFIYEFAEKIRTLLPSLRIGVAHGKLSGKTLENTIMKLYNGEFDILVATTLIENGVDLPRANTLIIIDADKLGLSALYQLRGRIGRNDKIAYAYFTYNPDKSLTEGAFKRLGAIMEFTELGSGFKIAMRDLEIRGAGNVLGKEQHGAMEKVGYDLYCKLLNDAVKELKGEKTEARTDVRVDVNLNAFISEEYIQNETERIKIYTQISAVSSSSQSKNIEEDLEKTYGQLPFETKNLIQIALLKNLLTKFGVVRIYATQLQTHIYFVNNCDKQKIMDLAQKLKNNNIKTEVLSENKISLSLNDFSIEKRVKILNKALEM